MKKLLLIIGVLNLANLQSQDLTPQKIVKNSIDFHDPNNLLSKSDLIFSFEESRPDGNINTSFARIYPYREIFEITRKRKNTITYALDKKDTIVLFNNKRVSDLDTIKKYRLDKGRAVMMKNYYHYLWHLPHKILDPGAILSEHFKTKEFNSHKCYELKVTYNENIGKDIWYFYFDISTYQLRGYRFYHDESKNDGEYIYLEGLTIHKDLRIPSKRSWYTHKEDKFLGSDHLLSIKKH